MVSRRGKMKGDTLPEVLVALAVLSCVYVLVFGALAQFEGAGSPALKWQAMQEGNKGLLGDYPERTFRDTLIGRHWRVMVEQCPGEVTGSWLRRVEVLDKRGRRWCVRERIIE